MKKLLLTLGLISQVSLANQSVLIGGRAVEAGEYEEVVRVSSGRSWCTGSLIGKKVLLTAAHCTEEGGELIFEYKRNVYKGKCELAPDYTRSVGDQDMALCKLDKSFPGPLAEVSKKAPRMGESVVLIGYGCVNPGGGGGNDGILRVGAAPVVKESTDEYYSFHAQGSSALCFGDSGGPSFDPSLSSDVSYVSGVNSRGDIRTLSLLTALYHPKSIKFMKDFEDKHDVKICGVRESCIEEEPDRCLIERAISKRKKQRVEIVTMQYDIAKRIYQHCLEE